MWAELDWRRWESNFRPIWTVRHTNERSINLRNHAYWRLAAPLELSESSTLAASKLFLFMIDAIKMSLETTKIELLTNSDSIINLPLSHSRSIMNVIAQIFVPCWHNLYFTKYDFLQNNIRKTGEINDSVDNALTRWFIRKRSMFRISPAKIFYQKNFCSILKISQKNSATDEIRTVDYTLICYESTRIWPTEPFRAGLLYKVILVSIFHSSKKRRDLDLTSWTALAPFMVIRFDFQIFFVEKTIFVSQKIGNRTRP